MPVTDFNNKSVKFTSTIFHSEIIEIVRVLILYSNNNNNILKKINQTFLQSRIVFKLGTDTYT